MAFLLPTIFLSTNLYAQGPQKLCFPSSLNAQNCITVNPNNPLPVTVTSGGGTGLVQSSPPNYANGASEPPTLLAPDGSLVTDGPQVIGTFTCSSNCGSTALATFVTWPYDNFSVSVSSLSGSLLQIQCDNGDNNYNQILNLEGYAFGGSVVDQGYITATGLWVTPPITAKRCQVYVFVWATETLTITIYGKRGNAPITRVGGSLNSTPVTNTGNNNFSAANGFVHSTALETARVIKNSAGVLYDFKCTDIAGAAAGTCIAYNGTSAPSTGALTGANVIDSCPIAAAVAIGCTSQPRTIPWQFTTGIVILCSTGTTPFTYATTTNTCFITASYQ